MSSHSHTHSHDTHGSGHHHSHTGGGDHTHDDVAAANRAHYDEHAAEQSKTELFVKLAESNAPYILEQYAFDKGTTTVLDFACGTGLTSRSIAAHVKSIVGVDISPVSIEHYNKLAQEAGYTTDQMHGHALELKGTPGELGDAKFDVVVSSMAYHHIDNIDRITRVLERFIKPGGALIIVDITSIDDGKEIVDKEYHHVVPHTKGFSEAEIRQTFEGVGLTSFAHKDAGYFEYEGKRINLFVARAIKPNNAA
jgi:2-polyprenyl-3-methyl-5-hydroxy-6-metoxy-1,4-benzoquinol methylase